MSSGQKNSANLHYTKAKIKPFLNPLFWVSSAFIALFFYGLWQYGKNPELFSRETGKPATSELETTNLAENNLNEDKLDENELAILVDIDNINDLFKQVELKSVVKGKPAENRKFARESSSDFTDFENLVSSFEEVKLNPLLTKTKANSNNKNKDQNNLFQELLKSENFGLNNSLFTTNPKPKTELKNIQVIRPSVELPTMQDLMRRQKSAMEQDPLKKALQNRQNLNQNLGGLGVNNGLTNNSITPNYRGIQESNINRNTNSYVSPYSSFTSGRTVSPTLGQNNIKSNLETNPNNTYQNNNVNNNSSVNTNPNNNQQTPQPPANKSSGFASYY